MYTKGRIQVACPSCHWIGDRMPPMDRDAKPCPHCGSPLQRYQSPLHAKQRAKAQRELRGQQDG